MCRILFSSLIETLFELEVLIRIIASLLVLLSSFGFSSNIIESKTESHLFFCISSIGLSSLKKDSVLTSSASLVVSPLLFVLLIDLSMLVSASCTFSSLFRWKFGLVLVGVLTELLFADTLDYQFFLPWFGFSK